MSPFLSRLFNDISNLLKNSDDYDVLLEIGQAPNTRVFKAHSIILKARCLYFKSALSNDWCKKDERCNLVFKKQDILPNVFEVILK